MLCGEWALVKRSYPAMTIMPLRCKCWTCETCRPLRAARLVHEARAGRPNTFITLTTRRFPGGCPHYAARRLSRAWRQVRREYVAAHGKGSLAFLTVFEATKQGWPHLHIVARCKWIDQGWLSKRMGALIGAPIVDVRRIKGLKEVAAYVAKYIGKNPHRFAGTKRYWRSLDFLLPPEEPEEEEADPCAYFEVSRFNWLSEVRMYVAEGWRATFDRNEATLVRGVPP